MVTASRSEGSTVFCKLEVHVLKLSQISRNRAKVAQARRFHRGGGAEEAGGRGKTRDVNPMKRTLLYHRVHSDLVLLLNLTRFSPRKEIYNGVTKNL